MKRIITVSLLAAFVLPATAKTFHVYPDGSDRFDEYGLQGVVSITNALAKCSKMTAGGDTIIVEPGIYDFSGIASAYTSAGGAHLSRHEDPLALFSIIGNTSIHWDDVEHEDQLVIFRGDKRFASFESQSAWTSWKAPAPKIANIVFENFTAEENDGNGNCGGVLRFGLENTIGSNGRPIVSNCVFRQNVSKGHGACIFGAARVQDCLFKNNNTMAGNGGAVVGCVVENCEFRENSCVGGSGGAVYNTPGATDCLFVSNRSPNNGGAINLFSGPISNCTFIANTCENFGGAVLGDRTDPAEIVGCHFLTNAAKFQAGAVYFSNKGSSFVSNCTFVCNSIRNTTYGGGAVFHASTDATLLGETVDCIFRDNVSVGKGGAACGGVYRACTFDSNVATNYSGGAIWYGSSAPVGSVTGCVFTNNVALRVKDYPCGGAICCDSGYRQKIADSKFYCNVSYDSGAVYNGEISGSAFRGNHSTANGGAIFKSTAVNCTFDGDYASSDYLRPGSACQSVLYDCDFNGTICESAATRCRFHGDISYHATAAKGVFYNQCWVTNSLITSVTAGSCVFVYNDFSGDGEFVNCTFADNSLDWYWGPFCARGVGFDFGLRFVNCVFNGTTQRKNGVVSAVPDIWGRNVPDGCIKLDHCAYGGVATTWVYGDAEVPGDTKWTNVGDSSFVCADPKFVGDRAAAHDCEPYSPMKGSPLVGAGALLGWTADDLDLAGNPRVKDGAIEIGCYQFAYRPSPLFLLLR